MREFANIKIYSLFKPIEFYRKDVLICKINDIYCDKMLIVDVNTIIDDDTMGPVEWFLHGLNICNMTSCPDSSYIIEIIFLDNNKKVRKFHIRTDSNNDIYSKRIK